MLKVSGDCRKGTVITTVCTRWFRSKAALEALQSMEDEYQKHNKNKKGRDCDGVGGSLVLYKYPCFSSAFAALFARLYHARLSLPFSLILPFSSVAPLRECDLKLDFVNTCYLLGFIGPHDFAINLSQFIPRVIAFDHRKSTAERVSQLRFCKENLKFDVDTNKGSASSVHNYFSKQLLSHVDNNLLESSVSLIDSEDEVRVSNMLRYIEDVDLRRWSLPDIKAFTIGLREEHLNLNCVTNPSIFDQLLKLDPVDFTTKGDIYTSSLQVAAKALLSKSFNVRLGRGLYGECLGVRADGNSSLSYEIGDKLSKLSEAAGLRPVGAVVFMQRGRMKLCLRSINSAADTCEIAKAYGGGGKPGSSSLVITMDEYNHWISGRRS